MKYVEQLIAEAREAVSKFRQLRAKRAEILKLTHKLKEELTVRESPAELSRSQTKSAARRGLSRGKRRTGKTQD